MNSDELFEHSQKASRTRGMQARALRSAAKAGYTVVEDGVIKIDIDKLRAALLDGSAWSAYMVGEKTIKIWARWVAGEVEPPEKTIPQRALEILQREDE